MNRFLEELVRFVDKYLVQPDPVDEEAVVSYWLDVDTSLLKWEMKYRDKPHYDAIVKMQMAAFDLLEDLYKEKCDG